jgi:hypothetical protein
MSTEKKHVYTTADFRKEVGKAFGLAYHAGEVVRVQNHSRPYVAVVSDQDGDAVEAIKNPEPSYDDMLDLARLMDWRPQKLETFAQIILKKSAEMTGAAEDEATAGAGAAAGRQLRRQP